MQSKSIEKLEKNLQTLITFRDEYLDLFFNPDERAFIDLEILSWFDEIEEIVTSLSEIVEEEK